MDTQNLNNPEGEEKKPFYKKNEFVFFMFFGVAVLLMVIIKIIFF